MTIRGIPGVRVEIALYMHSDCCTGPFFMPENLIETAPIFLKGRITDREWSTAMRRLQEIVARETPDGCDSCFYVCCEGAKGSMWMEHRMDQLYFRLSSTIKHLNECLFEPKGMCIAIINDYSTLAIALSPDECQVLKILS